MAEVTLTLPEAMKRAVAAYKGGHLREADRLARAILRVKADYFDALHLIGIVNARQGRFAKALASYDRALALRPHYVEALNNRGITLKELKRFDEALASYDRALALRPDYAEVLSNRGNTLNELKRFDEALASYDRALAVRPDYAEALHNRGITLQSLKRFDEALASYDRALALRPDLVETLNNRGHALHELKRFGEALASYDRALAVRPEYAEALNNRGSTLHELKRFDEALATCDRALAVRPEYAEALYNRGKILQELKRFSEALASYDRALAVRPDFAEALYNRGITQNELKRLDEALASYDRALALRRDYVEALNNRGATLRELKRLDEALASYQTAIALKPDLTEAYNNMGTVLKDLGKLEEAQAALLEALRIDPSASGVYLNLTELRTFGLDDPHLAAMETLVKSDNLSNTDRIELDFALGKAYADLRDYRRSFNHLLAGNARKRATISYDEEAEFAFFDRIEAVFTRALIETKSGGGDASTLPIFVLGMPRSGTTLVEQIIASHPMVYGAGELSIFRDIALAVPENDGNEPSYPEFVATLDPSELARIGANYVAALRQLAPKRGQYAKVAHVTDKMPSNYYFAGLIHLSLPNAKIVHTIRDPIDTCLSCFSKLFSVEQRHTYELGELGRYYRRYEQLMAHWHRVLPPGRILDVRYESVVADLESEARRIISYCGLPWDNRCLAFHKTNRPVQTASATQVRRPIYAGAVGRWRGYQAHLRPLLQALEIPPS